MTGRHKLLLYFCKLENCPLTQIKDSFRFVLASAPQEKGTKKLKSRVKL